MKISERLPVLVAAAVALSAGLAVSAPGQQQSDAATVAVGAKEISGVVSNKDAGYDPLQKPMV
jgi:hypothetical protein